MHVQTHRTPVIADREKTSMSQLPNGITPRHLPELAWQKSGRSNPSGNCVEMAALPGGGVAVRNSRHPGGPALIYTRDEIVAFLQGAKDGDFDNLIS
jgi:hypothetical protein